MAKKQNPEILCCAPLRGGTHSEWVSPLRWNPICHGKKAGSRNSGLCPSEERNTFYPGIFYASAIKKNSRICLKSVFPVLLITLRSFSVLKGSTHSILEKRRSSENSEIPKLFFQSLSTAFADVAIVFIGIAITAYKESH